MDLNPIVNARLVKNNCSEDFYKVTREDGTIEEIPTIGLSEKLKNEIASCLCP